MRNADYWLAAAERSGKTADRKANRLSSTPSPRTTSLRSA
jgi:hypothetical protein